MWLLSPPLASVPPRCSIAPPAPPQRSTAARSGPLDCGPGRGFGAGRQPPISCVAVLPVTLRTRCRSSEVRTAAECEKSDEPCGRFQKVNGPGAADGQPRMHSFSADSPLFYSGPQNPLAAAEHGPLETARPTKQSPGFGELCPALQRWPTQSRMPRGPQSFPLGATSSPASLADHPHAPARRGPPHPLHHWSQQPLASILGGICCCRTDDVVRVRAFRRCHRVCHLDA
jgi:hypothetical protein